MIEFLTGCLAGAFFGALLSRKGPASKALVATLAVGWTFAFMAMVSGCIPAMSAQDKVDLTNEVSAFVARQYSGEFRGMTGPEGNIGLRGPLGPKGDKGDKGDVGQGVQGKIGPQGRQGVQGHSGLAGTTGQPGLTGPSGSSGAAGGSGSTGPRGPVGDIATPLFSGGLSVNYDGSIPKGLGLISGNHSYSGEYSLHLETIGTVGNGDEARFVLRPIQPMAVSQLTSISWQEYLVTGQSPHVDVRYILADGTENTTTLAGNPGTLGEWVAWVSPVAISGAFQIVDITIEVDNYSVQSFVYLDQVAINGVEVWK